LETDGKLIVALLRMTFAPFGITSYILGVSSISIFDYSVGNLSYIFMTCSQCFLGCSLFTAVNEISDPTVQKSTRFTEKYMKQITFIVEIVMTLIITIVIGYISKNILQKKLIEQEK
jgi:uncharacterized membrane protein YdjX (TVP38/TMEM64 family)